MIHIFDYLLYRRAYSDKCNTFNTFQNEFRSNGNEKITPNNDCDE